MVLGAFLFHFALKKYWSETPSVLMISFFIGNWFSFIHWDDKEHFSCFTFYCEHLCLGHILNKDLMFPCYNKNDKFNLRRNVKVNWSELNNKEDKHFVYNTNLEFCLRKSSVIMGAKRWIMYYWLWITCIISWYQCTSQIYMNHAFTLSYKNALQIFGRISNIMLKSFNGRRNNNCFKNFWMWKCCIINNYNTWRYIINSFGPSSWNIIKNSFIFWIEASINITKIRILWRNKNILKRVSPIKWLLSWDILHVFWKC